MICDWCGDNHGVEQLCMQAQRGRSRRTFLFLSTAAVISLALPSTPELVQMVYHHRGPDPNLGKLVAEAWNKVIGAELHDTLFVDRAFKQMFHGELSKLVKE